MNILEIRITNSFERSTNSTNRMFHLFEWFTNPSKRIFYLFDWIFYLLECLQNRPNESFIHSNESFICSNNFLIRPNEEFFSFGLSMPPYIWVQISWLLFSNFLKMLFNTAQKYWKSKFRNNENPNWLINKFSFAFL